jgi:peptide deformylase
MARNQDRRNHEGADNKGVLGIVPVKDIPAVSAEVDLTQPMFAYQLCLRMIEVCKQHNGIGLSAVQVGIPLKLFVIRNDDKSFSYYANCRYEPVGDGNKVESFEGCLSLRNKSGELRFFRLARFDNIRLVGKQLVEEEKPVFHDVDKIISGQSSVVFQHEIDHQNNVLISDVGTETAFW